MRYEETKSQRGWYFGTMVKEGEDLAGHRLDAKARGARKNRTIEEQTPTTKPVLRAEVRKKQPVNRQLTL